MTSLSFFSLEQLLTALGVVSVLWLSLKAAWDLAQGFRIYVLSRVWKGVDLASYGSWAVVTGATAGIGKAYAHELARRGLNVVLISRSMEKLKKVAAEIGEQHGRSTKVIQADFTQGSEIYAPIQAALQGLEIGILVNNVGMSVTKPMSFLDVDNVDKYITDMVYCNMYSFVKMTQIVLPQMVARKKGIIINLSSSAGQRPFPLLLMYSGTKVFDDFFSQALDTEYRTKGILVQSITPMYVDSNLTQNIKNVYKKGSEAFVRQALDTVGLTNRTSGCLVHSLLTIGMLLIPEWVLCSSFSMNVMLSYWKANADTSKLPEFLEGQPFLSFRGNRKATAQRPAGPEPEN